MGSNNAEYKADLKSRVQLTNAEHLYSIKDENGCQIPYDQATGRQLFNHYRHRMTNYDQVLDEIRMEQQGSITGRQEKQIALAAAEHILEEYRNEHIKVIKDSQTKGKLLKSIFEKLGVSTAKALLQKIDSWSNKINEIRKLENSQRTLQSWNDTYRVQRELVKTLLEKENVSAEIRLKVDRIYGTRSVNKAVELGSGLLNLEKSETLKLIKAVVRYAKL